GDSPAARDAAQGWYDAARRIGSAADKAAASIHLGWFHTRVAEYDAALARFVEALGPDGLVAHPKLRALALHGRGRVHATRGDPERAVQDLEAARQIFTDLGDRASRAEVIAALGVVSAMREDFTTARAYFQEALATAQALKDRRQELVMLVNLAAVRADLGDSTGALGDFLRTVELARSLNAPSDLALAHINVGETLVKLGQTAEAVPHFLESLRLSREQHARQTESWSHENLSAAYEQLGQFKLALEHARQFRTLHDAMFSEESEARIAELETRYRAESRERENERLRSENALQQASSRRDRAVGVALMAGLAAVSFALIALVGRHRTARRHNRALAERNDVISRQKAELETLRDALEDRVAQRTEQLARANDELRAEIARRQDAEEEQARLQARYLQAQKMEAVGLLAGGVAHDFNNILTGIAMTCELALQDAPPDSPAAITLRDVLAFSHRAAHLTRQLLAYSRKQLLQPTVVHLHALIAHSLLMLTRIIGEDIRIQFTPGAARDNVLADPAQIEQILLNLAVNARDAMPGGGALVMETSVRVVTEPLPLVAGESLAPGEYITLRVGDTGTGMDEETLQRIFDPFFTTKPVNRGTGLGLSTVYGIVRQHRGAIQVSSDVGAGTTFTVLLPLLPEGPECPGGRDK
ncbi:MAG: tetratricopeptide repeat protein, partial [Vicinamibacterales bacterium]|nr:tetratricopeptide repeat protein [Vicinamibacterales bacterium]